MVGCKFEYAKQNYNYYSVDGDILITDKRDGKPNNGKVNVVVDGQKIDYFVSTKAEFTEAVAVENAVVFCNLLKSNYGYFFFSSSGKDPYKHGLPNIAKGVTVIGDTKLPYNGAPAMFGIKAPVNNKLNDVTFRNINFNGSNVQYGFDNYLYGNVVYENCIINASSDRAIHWADGDGTATYKNCEIQGRVAISSTVSAVNFIGCKFTNSSQTANHNLYTNATYTDCTFDLKDGTVTKAAIYADGSKVVMNNCTNVNGNLSDLCNASNGGSFTIDGAPLVKGTDALKEALASGATEVVVGAGEYTFPTSSLKEGTTLICEGTVFTGNSKLNINGATVVGATFSNPTGSAADQTINGTFKNCTFTGSNGLRYCYAGETVVFENCVFDGAVYGAHFDGGANEVLFKNCTFSGFNAFAGGVTKLTLDGCTFKSNGRSGYNGANLWGSTDLINCTFIFDGSAGTEWIHARGTEKTYNITNCVVTDGVNVSDLQTVFSDNGTNNTVTFN